MPSRDPGHMPMMLSEPEFAELNELFQAPTNHIQAGSGNSLVL